MTGLLFVMTTLAAAAFARACLPSVRLQGAVLVPVQRRASDIRG